MSHLDPSSLARYNSLVDPHLQSYFSSDRIQSHLKQAGLISRQGEILSESEYRTRLARLEHKRHVRHMLAENIVNRAVDMERLRQAEMKRQFEMVSKAALVNNIKKSQRRQSGFSGVLSNSADFGFVSVDSSWSQLRPKSAGFHNEFNDQMHIGRIQSAHTNPNVRRKSSSKTRQRSLKRSRTRSPSTQFSRSSSKLSDTSSRPCQITMVYYGPKVKVDYDHLVFEPTDEIMVMQQHCGGENILIYKEHLKAGAEFSFESRRHSDYPFGLSFYVNGFIDSRVSTCCEYKHRHGVRLGGDRGHFAIKSVRGSKPCIKCRFAKQARLEKHARSPVDRNDENRKPITIPLPVSDEPKNCQKPIEISVRRTSKTNDNYSDDFDGSDNQKSSSRNPRSPDSTRIRSATNQQKFKTKDSTTKIPRETSPILRKESTKKFSFSSDESSKEKIKKKNWKVLFNCSNVPKQKNLLLKFSLMSNDQDGETDTYQFHFNKFKQNSISNQQYAFQIQLKDIGKPEQIRLTITIPHDDDDDQQDIKWNLDHIELIDLNTESHYIFPCKQSIKPFQQKILSIDQESSRTDRKRKPSSSTTTSRPSSGTSKAHHQSPKLEQKSERSFRSSTSSPVTKQLQTKFNSTRRISPDYQTNRSQQSTPTNQLNDQENKTRYRVTIHPADDIHGEFNSNRNSQIYLRINNQKEKTNLTEKHKKTCPSFESDVPQTFEIDLIQNSQEKPKKLTIGYINSDITATKWNIKKIVLVNVNTGHKTIFICNQTLIRNDSNDRAERTFQAKTDQSDDDEDDLTPRNEKKPIDSERTNTSNIQKSSSIQKIADSDDDDDDDSERNRTPTKRQTNINQKEKSSSIQKLNDTDDDDQRVKTPTKQLSNNDQKQKSSSKQKLNDTDDDDDDVVRTPTKQQINQRKSPSPQKTKNDNENKQKSSSRQNTNEDSETPKREKTNGFNKEKSPSFQSMDEDHADYRKIFQKLDPDNKLHLGSEPSSPTSTRPKTRRGRDEQNDQQYPNQVIEPLPLDDLNNQTDRSINQRNQTSSSPSTATTTNQKNFNRFKPMYPNSDDDD